MEDLPQTTSLESLQSIGTEKGTLLQNISTDMNSERYGQKLENQKNQRASGR